MTYVSRPMGSRLGIHATKVEELREQAGLTLAGFRQDGTDLLKTEKEVMERELYRHADAHLPAGIGGPVPAPSAENAPDSEAEGDQEDDDTEDD